MSDEILKTICKKYKWNKFCDLFILGSVSSNPLVQKRADSFFKKTGLKYEHVDAFPELEFSVYVFKLNDKFYRVKGWYNSYEDAPFGEDDFCEVVGVPTIVTKWVEVTKETNDEGQ